jgi:hypothetical protein
MMMQMRQIKLKNKANKLMMKDSDLAPRNPDVDRAARTLMIEGPSC